MRIFKIALVLVVSIATGWSLWLHRDISDTPHYVTSDACLDCHEEHYLAWKDTLHPKQFRPVTSPADIVADFDKADPAVVTFTKADIKYVIGNKWEQVYVQVVDGEMYPLPAKWFITTQKWKPYKVKDWKETPLSTKCNGCHTTGFNPDTFEFSEFGIGCEACHGPGSVHVQHEEEENDPSCTVCHALLGDDDHEGEEKKTIIRSVNASVCGQCHSRGKQTRQLDHMETTFNFPLGYKPGEEISANFKQSTKATDKKKKYWWETGLSKNRHQEFADFMRSKHGKALKLLRTSKDKSRGELEDSCMRCHSADYIFAPEDAKPTLETAEFGITCVVCHDPHGLDKRLFPEREGPHRCGSCHIERLSDSTAKSGHRHIPCPADKVRCADCHMPYIVKSGGTTTIRSHAFQIVPPSATEKFKMPNSCQNGGCHKDKDTAWAIKAFAEFYPEAAQ